MSWRKEQFSTVIRRLHVTRLWFTYAVQKVRKFSMISICWNLSLKAQMLILKSKNRLCTATLDLLLHYNGKGMLLVQNLTSQSMPLPNIFRSRRFTPTLEPAWLKHLKSYLVFKVNLSTLIRQNVHVHIENEIQNWVHEEKILIPILYSRKKSGLVFHICIRKL